MNFNWPLLLDLAHKNTLPHAFLFYGLKGIGKKKMALDFVSWLFCSASQKQNQACLACPSCKKILNHNHPDLFLIDPEDENIKIETIRELLPMLAFSPLEASFKVVIINQAHQLTMGAANSLLKTLEEPPKQTLFFLIAPNLSLMLPTIRSRCQKLFFPETPLKQNHLQMEEFAKDLNELIRKKESFVAQSTLAQKWKENSNELPLFLENLKENIFSLMIQKKDFKFLTALNLIRAAEIALHRNVGPQITLENLFMDLLPILR